MGKFSVSIPLVTWRDDRPRFIPGPRHRRLGLKGEDLRHPDGSWFSVEEARQWSARRLALIAELEDKAPRQRRQLTAMGHATLAALYADWFATPQMNGKDVVEGKKQRQALKPDTVRYYRNGEAAIRRLDDGRIYNAPAAALTGRTITGAIDRIEIASGLAMARCARASLSALFRWARAKGRIAVNPMLALDERLPTLPPRIRVGAIAEMRHLVAAADFIAFPDIGDAITLGLWTAQRQNDRLALTGGQMTGKGEIMFRQSKKHGQPLLIRAAPELAQRLAAARARRADWRVNYHEVILDEGTRRPYEASWYRHKFRTVRQIAANGLLKSEVEGIAFPLGKRALEALLKTPRRKALADYAPGAWAFPPMPSLADFRDQDLRDTAVTWLALAACDKFEIASITGHSLKSIDEILKHYLGLHPELARTAIGKLVTWYEGEESK